MRNRRFPLMAIAVLPWLAGCGGRDLPELGEVEGTVTLDGEPLSGAMVQFHSESGGRPGTALTDESGHYELTYVGDVEGTPAGPARVEISTVWPDGEPPPGESEKIPAAYNSQSTLKREVKAGSNTFDFPLKSDGSAVN